MEEEEEARSAYMSQKASLLLPAPRWSALQILHLHLRRSFLKIFAFGDSNLYVAPRVPS